MTQSRNLIQHCRVSFAWLTLVLVRICSLHGAPAMAPKKCATPAVLNASRILPPQLLSGPNHRVQEQVRNDGFINIYTVDSKFGQFTAISTAVLRKRVHEINALAVMEKIQGTKEYSKSIKEAGQDTLTGIKNIVTKPVDTVKGAASGLGAAFRRAGDAISGPKRSESEDSRAKKSIGFSTTKR